MEKKLMDKLTLLNQIKEIYNAKGNIIEYLKSKSCESENSLEDIMISYDFQAGSYMELYEKAPILKDEYCAELVKVLLSFGDFDTILEAGVGEATTMGTTLKQLKKEVKSFGFDISWSRIKYARKFLNKQQIHNYNVFVGDLFNMPIRDNAIDIVYTSHSVEPNGGREKEAIEELLRITKKYLVLLEPAYELANEDAKERMKKHGYVTTLYDTAKKLGCNIIKYELFPVCTNPLNPTGIMIIKKDKKENVTSVIEENVFCCPITKTKLEQIRGNYYSEEALLVYPVIDEIPCLTSQNAVIATKYLEKM